MYIYIYYMKLADWSMRIFLKADERVHIIGIYGNQCHRKHLTKTAVSQGITRDHNMVRQGV